MSLLGSIKNKITMDENGENVLQLEINKVVLVYCNIVNNDYQQNSRVLYHLTIRRVHLNRIPVVVWNPSCCLSNCYFISRTN